MAENVRKERPLEWMFALRGPISPIQSIVFGILGFLLILLVWIALTRGEVPAVQPSILPSPGKVFTAFGELLRENELIKNLCLSLGFNLGGYIKSLALSLPIGFLIGLFPIFRASFQSPVDAFRFIPITAITSLFIVAFGIGSTSKINFLAFGIMIYLIPVVIQRINEVKDVYLKTVYTIGANAWQTITTVYIPSVLSKLSDDIRVLTAISWTYIIVAEGIASQGGLGSLIFFAAKRQGRPDKTFAILLIFILIGIIQDRLFVAMDRKFFPHKYQIKDKYKKELKIPESIKLLISFGGKILLWSMLAIYILIAINEFTGILSDVKILDYFFQDTCWVVHVIFLSIIGYQAWHLFKPKTQVT